MVVDGNNPINTAVSQALCAEILRKAENGTLSLTEELMGYSLASALVAKEYEARPAEKIELPKRKIAAPELLKGRLRRGLA